MKRCLLALALGGCAAASDLPPDDLRRAAPWEPATAPSMDPGESLDVDEAIALALSGNPRLRAGRLDAVAARARRITAETPPYNPELSIETARALPFGRADDFLAHLGVSQTFEMGGQRGARIGAADADIERAVAAVGDDARILRAQVAAQFYEVLYLQERERLAGENVELSKRFLETAEARFKAQRIPEIEVNVVRLEHRRARTQQEEAARETRIGRAKLAALMGRPEQAGVPLEGQLGAIVVIPARDRLIEVAQTHRTDLAAARAEARGQAERARLAAAQAVPDLKVGVFAEKETAIFETSSGTLSDRDRVIGIDLSLALPVLNQRRGERIEAEVERRRADILVEAVGLEIRRDVELALARLEAARNVVETYEREMNRLARQNLDDTQRAYEAGEVGTLEVLRAREDLARVRGAYVDGQFALRLALVEIEAAIGARLSEVK